MKNLLKTWRIWTVLSVLSLVMTCWLVSYATSDNDFSEFRDITALNSTIWNRIMDLLDQRWWTIVEIPQWSISAFVDMQECPTWWSRYEDADWRFLVWASSSRVGETWWNNYVTLTGDNFPLHDHKMLNYVNQVDGNSEIGSMPNNFCKFRDDGSYDDIVVDELGSVAVQVNPTLRAETTWYPTQPNVTVGHSSSMAGWGQDLDVTNWHVKVLFCVKD